ncbi:hypothetical protein Celaphus_00019320, partial [Cervus elaphus hippelaphus]
IVRRALDFIKQGVLLQAPQNLKHPLCLWDGLMHKCYHVDMTLILSSFRRKQGVSVELVKQPAVDDATEVPGHHPCDPIWLVSVVRIWKGKKNWLSNREWSISHLEVIWKHALDDLTAVKNPMIECFPPHLEIFRNLLNHQALRTWMQISWEDLEAKEMMSLFDMGLEHPPTQAQRWWGTWSWSQKWTSVP